MKTASFEQREWIDPWRDRRPMTDDDVLVTVWTRYGCKVTTATCDEGIWLIGQDVLAWMPLPDPFNPAEEDANED